MRWESQKKIKPTESVESDVSESYDFNPRVCQSVPSFVEPPKEKEKASAASFSGDFSSGGWDFSSLTVASGGVDSV